MVNTIVLQVDAETGRAQTDFTALGGAATKALNAGEREAQDLGAALGGAGRRADKLGTEVRDAGRSGQRGLARATQGAQSLGRRLGAVEQRAGRVGGAFGRLGGIATSQLGGIVAGLGLVGAATAITQKTNELRRLSQIAQINVEDFQRLDYQISATGGDSDDLSDALREMQLRLAEAESLGTGPATDGLRLLGLSIEDLQKLDAPGQFALLRDRISEVEESEQRLFLADELLGGSAERLGGILGLTAAEYANLRRESEDQTVATEENIEAIKGLTTGIGTLINKGFVVAINTVGTLISVFTEFTDLIGITKVATEEQAESVGLSVEMYEELRDRVIRYGDSADRIQQTERNLLVQWTEGNLTLGEVRDKLDSVIEGEIEHERRAREAARATEDLTLATEAADIATSTYSGSLLAQREELGLVALQAGLTSGALQGAATDGAAQPDASGWTRVANELGLGSDSALRFSASNLAAAATLDAVAAVAAGRQFEDVEIFATARQKINALVGEQGQFASSFYQGLVGNFNPYGSRPGFTIPSITSPEERTTRTGTTRTGTTRTATTRTGGGRPRRPADEGLGYSRNRAQWDYRQRQLGNECRAVGGEWSAGREPNFNAPLEAILIDRFDGTCAQAATAPPTVYQAGGVTVFQEEGGGGFFIDQEGNRRPIGGGSGAAPTVMNTEVNFYGDTYGVEDLEDRVLSIVVGGGRNGSVDEA